MEDLFGTYFDTLPNELLEIIIEVISSDETDETMETMKSLDNFEKVSYIIYKLMNDKNLWNRIISKSKYSSVIQDEIKGKDLKPKELRNIILMVNFYHLELPKGIFEDRTINIIKDIIYRIKIKDTYPQFYEHVKGYNLYAKGADSLYNKSDHKNISEWEEFFTKCIVYNEDNIDLFEFIKTGKLPDEYIYDGRMQFYGLKSSMYIAYTIISVLDINIQDNYVLFDLFESTFNYNFELYELLFTKVPKKKMLQIRDDPKVIQNIVTVLRYINADVQNKNYEVLWVKDFLLDFHRRINSL